MLILDQKVKVILNSKIRRHYLDLGYIGGLNEEIEVNPKDLTSGSHVVVGVICDICGERCDRPYKAYLRYHDDKHGDICQKCQKIVTRKTWMEKYGVDHPWKLEEYKNKKIATYLKNYGVDNPSKSDMIKEKKKNTCLNNYGVENPSLSIEIQNKKTNTLYLHGTVATSKPQYELYQNLSKYFEVCELNYPCGPYSLDIMIEYQNQKIDIEYDGYYFHKDREDKDKQRNDFVIQNGYKVLRFVSQGKDPEISSVLQDIENLILSEQNIIINHI